MRRLVVGCLGLVFLGCSNGPASPGCRGAPSQTQYTCPGPLMDAGCIGGPTCVLPQEDPNLDFPVGCQATLTHCGTYGTPIVCTCTSSGLGSAPPSWICREGVEPAGC